MLAPSLRRPLATLLAAAQFVAVAHLAAVPHTTSASGGVAEAGFAVEEHLDAHVHQGAHAHAPAPVQARTAEEHCAVLSLLSASHAGPAPVASRVVATPPPLFASLDSAWAPSRQLLLLVAPKASPPV